MLLHLSTLTRIIRNSKMKKGGADQSIKLLTEAPNSVTDPKLLFVMPVSKSAGVKLPPIAPSQKHQVNCKSQRVNNCK